MLQRLIDDLKNSTGASLRMTSLAALAGLALFVTLSFVCAAIFIAILHRYGAIEACLTLAGLFLVIALVIAAIYMTKKRQARARALAAAQRAREAAASAPMIDPMLLATALPIVRAIGLTRLIPLLAVAGVAYGYYMSRKAEPADDETEGESEGDEA
ncbi:hypothetical protein FNL55_22395 [Tardiphaga sp. vice352]|uniref:hypothetical protein n=1 Tax=unclassified Tardiphaga TaxID=2631404 RepID=UPI0011631528|nr:MULTISPECIES: hypothetical protein [unclassified Tardiphaga]QDM18468.1 hypothetical protein FNL53_22910 [Tardiphaga sp. vice278]QDM23468.1 hypothetical protein FIU28_21705 [Tardiphaga sp. vice154]QDM28691.1 hypothetical protein FNL56_23145 [Tardiphaga sp. vice304]QDM33792.1 hypothetical protein FNL55_22395 [Tardiphaga sp. vice352]